MSFPLQTKNVSVTSGDGDLAFAVVTKPEIARSAGLVQRGAIRFQSVSEPGLIFPPNLTAEKIVEKIQAERRSSAALRYINFSL